MSILDQKASVRNRHASSVSFETVQDNTDVLGNQAYGTVTISQLAEGINYNNVQSAIEDIRNIAILDVDSIIINDSGVSPAGQPQVDTWKINGTITDTEGGVKTIDIFGVPVKVNVGDAGTEIAVKLLAAIQTIQVEVGHIFDTVSIDSGNPTMLNIRYTDNQKHILTPKTQYGVSVIQNIISPAKPGYGAWTRIGAQTLTFDGQPSPTTLHYFKRIA
ncbi:baseplate wedge subunit [Pseudomonas phage PspYZU05]|uniref:Baseplate wedge subunit and tail pin n=1 Tax=Pseudomonas phage PspYZU05 TaxID=1983556 RepID=A0A2U7NF40_9CAUD|nr:baseplate wedge subunit [Pseudomonas phage PspYZU05]ASD52071.1 hypothetical protein PspYZU05_119 [Pseudomonas phage PspYZU05]